MQAARLATRLQREIRMLQSDPPPGVCAWPCDDSLSHLQAQIQGPDGTVYSKGLFKLEIRVPHRYPFEPPNVRFKTPIYHPNIDSGGRICLDILNMPPKGAWKPSLNIPTVLASIGVLLAEPNPDDGLMGDITAEYKHNRLSFDMTARNWTHQYAIHEELASGDSSARNPVAPDNVQQNTSTSLVQSSTEDRTTVTNNSEKCPVVSNSKLNLGTKLSLEKGPKEFGKPSTNTGAVEVLAVTSKRAFASIKNTLGTRQIAVQESPPLKKTSAESVVVGRTAEDADLRSAHNENSPVVDGSQRLGSSAVKSHKTKFSVPSVEFGKFKRSREGSEPPPSDSSATTPIQETWRSDKPSSLIGAVDSQCLQNESKRLGKESKCFGFSSRASRDSNTGSEELSEMANNLEQDGGLKSRGRVASDTGPVRILTTYKPIDTSHVLVKDQVRQSDQSSASTAQKGPAETPEGRTSPSFPESSTNVSSSQEDNCQKYGVPGQPQEAAETFMHGNSSTVRSDLKSSYKTIDQYLTRTSVEDHHLLVRKSVPGARSTSAVSDSIHSRDEPESKGCQSSKVEIVIIPDESDPELKKVTELSGSVSQKLAKKPPLPAKPATDIIVLDSESDEEPPKGRSRLSLSRRRVVRTKLKD